LYRPSITTYRIILHGCKNQNIKVSILAATSKIGSSLNKQQIIPTVPGCIYLVSKEPGDMREQLEMRADSEVRQAATHALGGEAAHLPGL
jgi:hypothetical protein